MHLAAPRTSLKFAASVTLHHSHRFAFPLRTSHSSLPSARWCWQRTASGTGGEWFARVSGHDKRFVPYNGGLGAEQIKWLRRELSAAAAAHERVIVLCHVIIEPRACGGSTMIWDYPEALEVIRSEDGP